MQWRSTENSTVPSSRSGELSNGASWRIDEPDRARGIGLLFSPGFGVGPESEVLTAPTPELRDALTARGFTLAGATYPSSGWTVADGLVQQPELAAILRGGPSEVTTVIGWGHSMGGLVTVGLLEAEASVLDGAVILCGSLAGAVAMLNLGWDAAFVLQVLVAPDDPSVMYAPDAIRGQAAARALSTAAETAEGRARVALGAAVGQLPRWGAVGTPRPDAADYSAQAAQQREVYLRSAFAPREHIEAQLAGNPSGNAEVDYAAQLAESGSDDLVRAMYAMSSADLDDDLARLRDAPRTHADPAAVARLREMLTPSGAVNGPVATMWCTGDVAPTLSQASAFADAVGSAGRSDQLRQFFVDRPGHLPNDAEILAVLDATVARLESGAWPAGTVGAGQSLDGIPFADVSPAPFLRPDRRS